MFLLNQILYSRRVKGKTQSLKTYIPDSNFEEKEPSKGKNFEYFDEFFLSRLQKLQIFHFYEVL